MRGEFSFRMDFCTLLIGVSFLCELRASARDLIVDWQNSDTTMIASGTGP